MAQKTTPQKAAGGSPQGGGAGQREPINKMEAVRRALAKFGKDAKPMQMQPWIRSEFGIAMSTDHISTYKGDILHKKAEKGKPAAAKAAPRSPAVAPAAAPAAPARAPAAARPQAQPPAKAPAGGSRSGDGIRLEDLQAVQGLLGRVGADTLRGLIDLLARRPG